MSARATGMLMIVYAGGAFVAMMAGGRLYNRAGMRRCSWPAWRCTAWAWPRWPA